MTSFSLLTLFLFREASLSLRADNKKRASGNASKL